MSRMSPRATFSWVLALTLSAACQSREREAGQLLIQAVSLLQREDFVELKKHLDSVISEYPDTEAAQKAAEMQTELAIRTNNIAQTVLQSAVAASIGYAVSYPDDALSLQKVREFGFEGRDGVEIDFVRSGPSDFLITASHVAGDKIFTAGRDGVVSAEAK